MNKCKHEGLVTYDNCCYECGANLYHERIAELEKAIVAVVKDADRVQGWYEVNRDEFLAMAELVGVSPDA